MTASSSDIDFIIRRSVEMPDSPVTALIVFFAAVYAIAGIVMVCAAVLAFFEK